MAMLQKFSKEVTNGQYEIFHELNDNLLKCTVDFEMDGKDHTHVLEDCKDLDGASWCCKWTRSIFSLDRSGLAITCQYLGLCS